MGIGCVFSLVCLVQLVFVDVTQHLAPICFVLGLTRCCCVHVRRRSDRGGSLDQESFLDRIERLAYADKRRLEASRSALADHVHNSECTFRPAINRRSARMVKVSVRDVRVARAGKAGGTGLVAKTCALALRRS
jgi:hypothetical protein